MAYALLAGLPAYVGLYASIVPLVIYAVFGTSRQLAVGPVAMVSLLVAAGVGEITSAGTDRYVELSILLAFMVGVIQTAMGGLKLGFLVNFLSHPVVSGFTSAAALIIGCSQISNLTGVSLERSHHVHTILFQAAEKFSAWDVPTLVIGFGSIGVLHAIKRWAPRIPGALLVVVISTLSVWFFELNVEVVGVVPAGLPDIWEPSLEWADISALMAIAMTISFVGFMESVSVAKAFAARNGYDIDADRELIGLGLSNVFGAFCMAYPVTGGFSRSAVNAQAGAQTGIAGIITAGLVALSLLFLTPLFFYLPKAVLAAIIMTAVFGLIDVREVQHLWVVKRGDLAMLILTFGATLSFGIKIGILSGVSASMFMLVFRATRPHTVILGQLPGTTTYRNIVNFPEATVTEGIVAIRIDANFFYGNVMHLKETLIDVVETADVPVKSIVIDATSVNQLDSSADSALHELHERFQRVGVEVFFAGTKGPVREVWERSGFRQLVGEDHFFIEVHDAMEAAKQRNVHANISE
jgi:SulP family sulfate permease